MLNLCRSMAIVALLLVAGACTQAPGTMPSTSAPPNVATTPATSGQSVNINQPGRLFSMVVYGYDQTLGSDKVTDGKLPGQYGKELLQKATLANTGVKFYSGPCVTLTLVHVVGVSGQAQVLQGNNMPAGYVNMTPGSTVQMCGSAVAKTVLVLPRSAWTGKDPVVCYELSTPGYRTPSLPKKVEGPFVGRHNVDCTPEGDIKKIMNDASNTHFRMHLVIAGGKAT